MSKEIPILLKQVLFIKENGKVPLETVMVHKHGQMVQHMWDNGKITKHTEMVNSRM